MDNVAGVRNAEAVTVSDLCLCVGWFALSVRESNWVFHACVAIHAVCCVFFGLISISMRGVCTCCVFFFFCIYMFACVCVCVQLLFSASSTVCLCVRARALVNVSVFVPLLFIIN